MEEAVRAQSLGECIRQARLGQGLSGAQLARRAGVHPSNISRIESGETASPTPELLRRIARALDLDQADLLAYLGLTVPWVALPLRTYLRTAYPSLSDEALQEAEDAVVQIAERYEDNR